MDNNLNFDVYLKERNDKIQDAVISFMGTVLRIPEDQLPNISWKKDAVESITNTAERILKILDVYVCRPKYITNNESGDNLPCYATDSCNVTDCPFKNKID